MSVDIVFLDAGETILHPHPSFTELFAQVCAAHGTLVQAGAVAEVQARLAPHLVDLAEETGVERGPTLSADDSRTFWTYLYRRFLSELGIDDPALPAELYTVFSTTSTYRLFDDVLPTLDRLAAAGYRIGLISNFEGWLEKLLVELEVGHLFDVVVISGVEGVEKPDLGIYRLALERARAQPGAAVHVGDSVTLDVEPAAAAGLHAILLDRWNRNAGRAGVTISSLEELPEVIPNL
ncbi:MAG: HAD family hydrolase [Actinomycetota bacterium]